MHLGLRLDLIELCLFHELSKWIGPLVVEKLPEILNRLKEPVMTGIDVFLTQIESPRDPIVYLLCHLYLPLAVSLVYQDYSEAVTSVLPFGGAYR